MHASYMLTLFGLSVLFFSLFAVTAKTNLMNEHGLLLFFSVTGNILGFGWLLSTLSMWRADRSVKRLLQIVRDETSTFKRVRVLPQSKMGRLHSRIFNGPGIRKAIDGDGNPYWVPYKALLHKEFEAKMYSLNLTRLPYPIAQPYAIVVDTDAQRAS